MTKHNIIILLVILALKYGTSQQKDANTCIERNGRFPHPKQCDAYIECEDGVPFEKLCPDGLLFNPKARFFSYPCQYPVEVDCAGRTKLQEPFATENCPHSYGYFKIGDEGKCGKFFNCVEGIAYEFDCPAGLAFNQDTLRCDWPDQVDTCDVEAYLGFSCPEPEGVFSATEFRSYRSPYDCSKYFICINGKPRMFNCPKGQGFSIEAGSCLDFEQVPDCVFATGDEPSYFTPEKSRKQKRNVNRE